MKMSGLAISRWRVPQIVRSYVELIQASFAATVLVLFVIPSSLAQPYEAPMLAGVPTFDIWDVELGEPIDQIPFRGIAYAACGTNGGPPSTIIHELANYEMCPAEASGLHEVYFEYDDEQAYIGRALRVEWEAVRAGTSMYGHPIIPSVLVDDKGIVRGLRVVTDNRTTESIRASAVRLAVNLKGRYSSWNLSCDEISPQDGQTPIGAFFVHDLCTGTNQSLDQNVLLDAHYFRRRGQTGIDVHSQQVVEGAYESLTWLELVQEPYQPSGLHTGG